MVFYDDYDYDDSNDDEDDDDDVNTRITEYMYHVNTPRSVNTCSHTKSYHLIKSHQDTNT